MLEAVVSNGVSRRRYLHLAIVGIPLAIRCCSVRLNIRIQLTIKLGIDKVASQTSAWFKIRYWAPFGKIQYLAWFFAQAWAYYSFIAFGFLRKLWLTIAL